MKNASIFLSMISAGVLTLSVAHDFGYLLRFGISFAEAPTTLSDHIRGSLVWIPTVMLGFLGGVVIELINQRVECGMTEEEIIAKSRNPQRMMRIRESPKYMFIGIAILVPVAHFFVAPMPVFSWAMSLIVGWYVLHEWIFGHTRMREKTSRAFLLLALFGPLAIMSVAYYGYSSADSLITEADNEYVFAINGEQRRVVLARHFEKYFLVWNPEKSRSEFIETNSVTAFHQINKEKENNEARKHPGDAEETSKRAENNPRQR